MIGHFVDKSFKTIICTGTDNSKETRKNTPKMQQTKNTQTGLGQKNTKKTI